MGKSSSHFNNSSSTSIQLKMIRRILAMDAIGLAMLSINTAVAQQSAPITYAGAGQPTLMERQKEITLALSACPRSVVDKAGVYVLEKSGYVKVRESQNGFTALVGHLVPTSVEPQCLNAEATRSHLPAEATNSEKEAAQ